MLLKSAYFFFYFKIIIIETVKKIYIVLLKKVKLQQRYQIQLLLKILKQGEINMNFLQLAKERYSVRKFSDKKVEKEKLDLILEAGRVAPTAVNYQPQRILVLDNEDNLAKLKLCTPYHFYAPLALLICYDSTSSWKRPYDNEDMGVVDASIVTTHMMLQAAELGLGSTWVGHFDPDAMKKSFELPEYLVPVALLPIGYPRSDSAPHPKLHNNRYDIKETVFFNSFEGIVQGPNNEGKH